MINRTLFLEVSSYEADGGQKIGKLPGSVQLADLRALGHPESPIRAIRSKCLDCSGGVTSEVRKCVAVTCSLWPFRMGSNPFHGKKGSDRDSTGWTKRIDKTGRSKGESRHVRLHHWMLNCSAWKSLPAIDRALFVELAALYNGSNNGSLGYSVRAAAESLSVSPQTAMRALQRLQERGFIVRVTKGAFSRKARHASEWRLTEHPCDVTGEMATKAFMVWKPSLSVSKTKLGISGGTDCFPGGTVGASGGTATC